MSGPVVNRESFSPGRSRGSARQTHFNRKRKPNHRRSPRWDMAITDFVLTSRWPSGSGVQRKKWTSSKRRAWTSSRSLIEGRKIAATFWGEAWCDHLESFSDFANRLPRGRTYVRNGSVCHLAIAKGHVEAKVSGSELYNVTVKIKTLPQKKWNELKKRCTGQIGSLLELLSGQLSESIMQVVTDRKEGLFPLPGEISFDCDCPDWASMCKHVAAVLYGVGSRFDHRPELLFELRGVDVEELIETDAENVHRHQPENHGRQATRQRRTVRHLRHRNRRSRRDSVRFQKIQTEAEKAQAIRSGKIPNGQKDRQKTKRRKPPRRKKPRPAPKRKPPRRKKPRPAQKENRLIQIQSFQKRGAVFGASRSLFLGVDFDRFLVQRNGDFQRRLG